MSNEVTNPASCQTAVIGSFWKKCDAKVKEIASQFGIDCILYGSGYPVSKPNIVVTYKDALSGEGSGYNVYVYPEGDGYGKPYKYFSVVG
jgi:short-subunit dehydrogenase